MVGDGLLAKAENVRDFPVTLPRRDEAEHFDLARAQTGWEGGPGCGFREHPEALRKPPRLRVIAKAGNERAALLKEVTRISGALPAILCGEEIRPRFEDARQFPY